MEDHGRQVNDDVTRGANVALGLHKVAREAVETLVDRAVARNGSPALAPLLRVAIAELMRRELKRVVKEYEQAAGRSSGEILGEHADNA